MEAIGTRGNSRAEFVVVFMGRVFLVIVLDMAALDLRMRAPEVGLAIALACALMAWI